MKNPSISVVVATYNRGEALVTLLQALTHQTIPHQDYELIIVNDGSTDQTEALVERFKADRQVRITLLYQKNKGPAAARNTGIRQAAGEIIAFTDDDCIPDTNWLEVIMQNLNSNSIAGLQGSTYTTHAGITPLTHQIDNPEGNKSVPTCNAAYRKDVLQQVGGFDELFPFPHNEDADLAWRILPLGAIPFCKEMRVYHPPREDRFRKIIKRMRIMESEFRLFYKLPDQYKQLRAAGPWRNIYWEIGCKTQWYYFKSRFKYWQRPSLMIQGIAITLIWWFDLFRLFPRFWKANQFYRKEFAAK